MSRYDRTKKRRDKIVQFIKEYGALSTKDAHKLLTENGFTVNHRTVQRDFEELQVQKIIKPNLPVGREQTYSLVEEKKKDKEQKFLKYCVKQGWITKEFIEKYEDAKSLTKISPELFKPLLENCESRIEVLKKLKEVLG